MRRIVLAGLVAGTLAVAAPAEAQVPRHLHCMTNASGNTHAIARGVTANTSQTTFERFHFGVHIGVFAQGPNPHLLEPSFTGEC